MGIQRFDNQTKGINTEVSEINKKIVIAAEIFPPDIGGPATYSKMLADELSKLEDWKVEVICYSDHNHDDKIHRIIRSKFKPWHYFKYLKTLKKLSTDADIIYAQGPVAAGLPALHIKRMTGNKLVVKVVGDYAWEIARNNGVTNISIDEFQGKKFSGKIGRRQKVERKVCQSADKIIVPSIYLKKIVTDWGVDENKIEVICNAVSNINQSVEKIQTKKDIILSIGRLVSWKGFDLLIDLMPDLLKVNPNFKLVILGDGPDKERLQAKAKNNPAVEIKRVSPNERDQYLKTAKMFVLNTGYEGFPHTVLEAMTVGTPVITTNVCGNPEIIKDNHNGLLVEHNNRDQIKEAILKIYRNPELGSKLSLNAREFLKGCSYPVMIQNTLKLLNSI